MDTLIRTVKQSVLWENIPMAKPFLFDVEVNL